MSTRGRLIKANVHIKSKQYPQAAELLKPLLKKKKPDPGALHLMSVICEHQRQATPALEYAKKANTAKPNDMSKMIIARSYRAMGKTDDSIQWTTKFFVRILKTPRPSRSKPAPSKTQAASMRPSQPCAQ